MFCSHMVSVYNWACCLVTAVPLPYAFIQFAAAVLIQEQINFKMNVIYSHTFSCTISNHQFYLTSWCNKICETSPSLLQPHLTDMYTHKQPQHPPSHCLLLPLICSSPPSNLSQYFSLFLLISSGAAITLIKAKPLAVEQLCSVIIELTNHTACSHNKHNISTFLWLYVWWHQPCREC